MIEEKVGRNGYLLLCKKCGHVSVLHRHEAWSYSLTCPVCGFSGKLKRKKVWHGGFGVGLPMLSVAGVNSKAGLDFLKILRDEGHAKF